MKRTCRDCKALSVHTYSHSCDLGYKTKTSYKDILGFPVGETKPLEECPKPKTTKKYVELALKQIKFEPDDKTK